MVATAGIIVITFRMMKTVVVAVKQRGLTIP
jgi:hypothetical protein